MEFFRCNHCGQIIGKVKDKNVPIICCGEAMSKIEANTTDAAMEKHVPVGEVKGNIVEVTVGSTAHPMLEEHFIEWVALETKTGNQRKKLNPGDEPKVSFAIVDGDEVLNVYAYCNLHSLWKN